jgi:DNA-binding NarL/FixJ family response regulator
MRESKIRLMLLDDHPAIRHGLAMAINLEDDMIVSAQASNAESALAVLAKGEIDVVLVDISLAGGADGFDFIKAVSERFGVVKTLTLSMYDEALYAEKAILAGAMGYLSKKEPVEEIINAVREVIKGNLYLPGDLSEKLILKLMKKGNEDESDPLKGLSPREREILGFIGAGYTPREIARDLKLSINTVESHRRNLKEKLGLASSSELVKYAIKFKDN